MRHYNIPIFIPELACPHQCVFCNQAKISGHAHVPQPGDIAGIVDSYLASFTAAEREINIAFFGGSFTGIEIALQEQYLRAAHRYVQSGEVQGIRLSTRPDYISPTIIEMLLHYGVTCVELGAQSMHSEVLAKSGRGHTVQHVEQAAELINGAGIELGLQMMLGLPGDTKVRSLFTAKEIIRLGAKNTRIYPTLVIEDTALASRWRNGLYQPQSLSDAVDWAKEVYLLFLQNGVNVLRTGLHPSEELSHGRGLLAGPYHASFKELMLTAIWRDLLAPLMQSGGGKLCIRAAAPQLNYAIGYQQSNRIALQAMWRHVAFVADTGLQGFDFKVERS